jgi:hypothetical protein
MKHRARFPIRIKFMLTLLLLVTGVVTAITFATANLFQEDKKTYVNGLTSMVALGTADDARFLLASYGERLQLYARLMLDREAPARTRESVSRVLFEEFPELVAVTIDDGTSEPLRVYSTSQLDGAGLDREDVVEYEESHPVPQETLLRGEPFVRSCRTPR